MKSGSGKSGLTVIERQEPTIAHVERPVALGFSLKKILCCLESDSLKYSYTVPHGFLNSLED
ncbi:hypothetical protein MCERE10_01323 [Burkholderiaceae bacterium]|jgi:hypothetical protein